MALHSPNFLRSIFAMAAITTLLSSTSISLAAKAPKIPRLPHGCREIGTEYQDRILVLKPEHDEPQVQTIYLLHNLTGNSVLLELYKMPHEKLGPSYRNTIKPNEWGALAVSKPLMHFACGTAGEDNSSAKQIDCKGLFEICQYNHAKFSDHNSGTYWVVPSDTRTNTINQAIETGVFLKW